MSRPAFTVPLLVAVALFGCDDKDLKAPIGAPDAGMIGAGGQGGGGQGGGQGGAGGEGGQGGAGADDPLPPLEGGCAVGECMTGVCRLGICVTPPPEGDTTAAWFSCDDTPRVGSSPDFSCWAAAPRSPADGPDTIESRGFVEFFGDGELTVDLALTFYRADSFDPSGCASAADGVLDINEARRLVSVCIDETNTSIAEATTFECGDPDKACYTATLPTGVPLVARVEGDLETWVTTYVVGLYINPCLAPAPRLGTAICPEEVPDAPDGDWGCDLVDTGDGPFYYKDLTVISQATWTSFPPTAGLPRINLGKGAVAGRLYDCGGRSVMNATFSLSNPGEKLTYFNGDPDDTVPQPGLTYTNTRGTYADLNTPAGPNAMVAVAWQDGELKTIGFERFFVLPNTVVIFNPNGRKAQLTAPPY